MIHFNCINFDVLIWYKPTKNDHESYCIFCILILIFCFRISITIRNLFRVLSSFAHFRYSTKDAGSGKNPPTSLLATPPSLIPRLSHRNIHLLSKHSTVLLPGHLFFCYNNYRHSLMLCSFITPFSHHSPFYTHTWHTVRFHHLLSWMLRLYAWWSSTPADHRLRENTTPVS